MKDLTPAVAQPENWRGNVISEMNLALLVALNSIPFPQRVVRMWAPEDCATCRLQASSPE